MASGVRPHPSTVVYDPDAVIEPATAVKSKEERRAIFNAVDKLRQLGEQLAPPHMKPLKGLQAGGLRELRPRQGRSDWRALYIRRGWGYVIVAIDRHDNFDAAVARAQRRAAQYDERTARRSDRSWLIMVADSDMTSRTPHDLTTHDELLAAELAADPEFAGEWERLAVARMLAVQLIRYRAVHHLSQRALAAKLGVSQPRIVELESGEKTPTFDTMVKIAAATGMEFAIDIAPAGRTAQLVGKAVRDTPAHVYAGASVLVAAR